MEPTQTTSGGHGRGSGRIWLIGCAVALGAALLLALTVFGLGAWWVVSPGRQAPTAVAVGPRSVGVARLENAAGDAGIRALLVVLVTSVQQAQAEARDQRLPPFIEQLQRWQLSQGSRALEVYLPDEATLSLEPPAGGGEEGSGGEPARSFVLALNFRRFVRPAAAFVGRALRSNPQVRVREHRGREVLVLGDGPSVCFAGGTVLVGKPFEALTEALDRLIDERARALPASVLGLRGHWDLYGALEQPPEAREFAGSLAAVAGDLDAPEEPERRAALVGPVRAARFSLDVKSADELRGMWELTYDTPEAARSAEAPWRGRLEAWRLQAAAAGLTLTGRPVIADRRLRVEGGLTGLEQALHTWAVRSAREMRERERERGRR